MPRALVVRCFSRALAVAGLTAAFGCSSANDGAVAPPAAEPSQPIVAAAPHPSGPPVARVVDFRERQFGIEVADPYRWMEGAENAEYTSWLSQQGEYAKHELANAPGRDGLFARIRELGLGVSALSGMQRQTGRTIYSTVPPGAQLAKLVTRDGDKERILLDPEKLGAGGAHASLNSYSLSPDGKFVGYVIAFGGSEAGEIRVMDVATGKETGDVVPSIWGEFAPSWLPDSKSFFYTQMTPPSAGGDPMLNMRARYHKLGSPAASDVTLLDQTSKTFKPEPREFPGVSIDPGAPTWVVASAGGARSEARFAIAKLSELDLRGGGKTPWKVIADYDDAIESVTPRGGRLYFSTYKNAPNRKVLSVSLDAPELAKAKVEIPEDPSANLDSWTVARDGIYLVHDKGGLARLSRWAWTGKPVPIELPAPGWIYGVIADSREDGALYTFDTWLTPRTYFAYDPKAKKATPTGLSARSQFNDPRVTATEVEVPSADGAMVPLSILSFKDAALDGSHPTLIDAYGAYGNSQHAYFDATRLAWLERGGVWSVCHVRGGGEKGHRWQDDGSRDKKLNGVRDLVACAEYLVAHKYTTTGRLGIQGASAGGILMGRTLDERPDLFAAVHIHAGMVNPLRLLAAPNGENQFGELGDPRTEPAYKWILAMDPYLNVKQATRYPSVIFTVGLNDRRVVPWMTGKMAARLSASTTSGKPILIRVESDSGHGIGSTRDQEFAENADAQIFMLEQFTRSNQAR